MIRSHRLTERFERLHRQVLEVYQRFELQQLLAADFIPHHQVCWPVYGRKVKKFYRQRRIFDPSALPFRRLTPDLGTIIDVGGSWGLMTLSMRGCGVKSPILSFEALEFNRASLNYIKELEPSNYDFRIGGIGDRNEQISLYTPVINGCAIPLLTSSGATLTSFFADWLIEHIRTEMGPTHKARMQLNTGLFALYDRWLRATGRVRFPGVDQFRLCQQQLACSTLDHVLTNDINNDFVKRIAAIKIDVEGMEDKVIAGAKETIEAHQPMIMTEGANRNQAVVDHLQGYGYLYADQVNDQLQLFPGMSIAINGFWVHKTKVQFYRDLGLLL